MASLFSDEPIWLLIVGTIVVLIGLGNMKYMVIYKDFAAHNASHIYTDCFPGKCYELSAKYLENSILWYSFEYQYICTSSFQLNLIWKKCSCKINRLDVGCWIWQQKCHDWTFYFCIFNNHLLFKSYSSSFNEIYLQNS